MIGLKKKFCLFVKSSHAYFFLLMKDMALLEETPEAVQIMVYAFVFLHIFV